MPEIRFRKAYPEDLNQLTQLEQTCFDKSIQIKRSSISRYIKSPSIDVIIAHTLNNDVVGSITVFYRSNSYKAYIQSLAVMPQYRRKGIARNLKDMAILYAYSRGMKELQSDVAVSNKKMIKLNQSLGFKIIKKRPHYYGKGKHGYRMVKD